MSTVAEIKAAIPKLTLEEREEIKLYLRQLMAKDSQDTADEKPKQKPKPQAP